MALGEGIGCELRRFYVLETLPFVVHSGFFPFDLSSMLSKMGVAYEIHVPLQASYIPKIVAMTSNIKLKRASI